MVKQRYGAELRNKTLASIKSEISLALSSLLEELRTTENSSVLRVQQTSRNNNNNSRNDRSSRYRSDRQSSSSSSRSNRYCCLCRTANRPDFNSHFLSQCSYLPEVDRQRMSSSVRNIEITQLSSGEQSLSNSEEELEDDLHNNYIASIDDSRTPAPDDRSSEPVTRRVMVRKSPMLSCFYKHHPVSVCLDTGSESNLISEKCAKKLELQMEQGTQGAIQADAKTPLTVLGEIKDFTLTRGAHDLPCEALVVKEDIGDVVGGEPFLEVNDIAIRPAKKEIRIKGLDLISYADGRQ